MTSRRTLKAAEAIREVVSMAILTEVKDPRVRDVTVTGVEVSPDMRSAKILVSVMGNESKEALSLRGLESAAGFLQQKVAKRIDTRFTPRLVFAIDKGVKNSLEVARILREVLPKEEAAEASDAADDTAESPVGTDSPPEDAAKRAEESAPCDAPARDGPLAESPPREASD